MSRNRTRSADDRKRRRKAATDAPRMPGLRWVPVPLAFLLAVIGWLIFGSAIGQHALASAHAGPEQGGMGLTVNQAVWMADDMADPGSANPKGFQMPDTMMPGMQTVGDKRLRIELYLRNISGSPQRYGLAEFRLLGTGTRAGRLSTTPRYAASRCQRCSLRTSRRPLTSTSTSRPRSAASSGSSGNTTATL